MHANVTDPVDAPPALVARILEDNALDVELYEFATRLVAERAARRVRTTTPG